MSSKRAYPLMSVPTLALLMPSILLALIAPSTPVLFIVGALVVLVIWDRYSTGQKMAAAEAAQEEAIKAVMANLGGHVLPDGRVAIPVSAKGGDSNGGSQNPPTVH